MKTLKEQFKETQQILLTPQEKQSIREQVLWFMNKNPVRVPGHNRLHHQGSISNQFSVNQFKLFFIQPMPIFLALALLFTGGVSFAAEKTVPGDLLYPVKVGVNEEVRGWVALSDHAKASWDARVASRRLEEAEELAARTEL